MYVLSCDRDAVLLDLHIIIILHDMWDDHEQRVRGLSFVSCSDESRKGCVSFILERFGARAFIRRGGPDFGTLQQVGSSHDLLESAAWGCLFVTRSRDGCLLRSTRTTRRSERTVVTLVYECRSVRRRRHGGRFLCPREKFLRRACTTMSSGRR